MEKSTLLIDPWESQSNLKINVLLFANSILWSGKFATSLKNKHRNLYISIRSDEGLALETSAFESLYGG